MRLLLPTIGLFVIASLSSSVQGQTAGLTCPSGVVHCWTCHNAANDEECLKKGSLEPCNMNDPRCEKGWKYGRNGQLQKINMQCREVEACTDGMVNSPNADGTTLIRYCNQTHSCLDPPDCTNPYAEHCWYCNKADDLADCEAIGNWMDCQMNNPRCEVEFKYDKDDMLVYVDKTCREVEACQDGVVNSPNAIGTTIERYCTMPEQCTDPPETNCTAGTEVHCWTCHNAADMDDCLAKGELRRCNMARPRCEIGWHQNQNGNYKMFMQCRELEACQDGRVNSVHAQGVTIERYCNATAMGPENCLPAPCVPGDNSNNVCWNCGENPSLAACIAQGQWVDCNGNSVCETETKFDANGDLVYVTMGCHNAQSCTDEVVQSGADTIETKCNDPQPCDDTCPADTFPHCWCCDEKTKGPNPSTDPEGDCILHGSLEQCSMARPVCISKWLYIGGVIESIEMGCMEAEACVNDSTTKNNRFEVIRCYDNTNCIGGPDCTDPYDEYCWHCDAQENRAECDMHGMWMRCIMPNPTCETMMTYNSDDEVISMRRQCRAANECHHQEREDLTNGEYNVDECSETYKCGPPPPTTEGPTPTPAPPVTTLKPTTEPPVPYDCECAMTGDPAVWEYNERGIPVSMMYEYIPSVLYVNEVQCGLTKMLPITGVCGMDIETFHVETFIGSEVFSTMSVHLSVNVLNGAVETLHFFYDSYIGTSSYVYVSNIAFGYHVDINGNGCRAELIITHLATSSARVIFRTVTAQSTVQLATALCGNCDGSVTNDVVDAAGVAVSLKEFVELNCQTSLVVA